jgi:hypothetical protein
MKRRIKKQPKKETGKNKGKKTLGIVQKGEN